MAPGPVVVLGGGIAGLAAGYYLARDGWPVTIVERAPAVGGLCGSFESHGFTLDHGPHKLYSVVPGILDEIRALMGDGLIEHKKKNRIRLLDRFMSYPLSLGNLLPLTHFNRLIRGILLKGNGWWDLWPSIWPLLLFTVVVMTAAVKFYRRTLD